ncbi:MAG: LysR family transcriptional regulator [Holophagaceae bacterium]|nr:LysR family transcriptional regulator [Holophagaceae bacterium]
MDTKLLNCFRLVVEHQSFTKAARLLGITQSAASYQIAALERELGITLFRRLPQSLRLTPQGRHFFYEIEDVLSLYRKVVGEARDIEAGRLGQVRLGIAGHAGGGFVPSLIKAFRQRHPGTLLQLSRLNLADLERALEEGQLDVGVTMSFSEKEHPGFGRRLVGMEPLAVMLPEDHLLSEREFLTVDELESMPIVHLLQDSDPPDRSGVIRMFARHGLTPNLVHRVPDFDSVVLLVEAGEGLAVFPAYRAATCGSARVKIIPLAGDGSTEDVFLVWNREALNPALEVLLAEADAILAGESLT